VRQRVLGELLRLEPVVGHLYRRAVREIVLEEAGKTVTIPAGALLDLYLHAANTDPEAVGGAPLAVCPGRELASGVQPPVLSFGDGAHRCPGAFIALQESDIFLRRLFALPVRLVRPPALRYNELIESYEVRGLEVALEGAGRVGMR
jgi:cytochrome P450